MPDISVQFARQMEFKGEYESALEKFESALNTITNEEEAAGAGMGGGGLLGGFFQEWSGVLPIPVDV